MQEGKKQARQHTGGMANLAGNVFESHFGTWRVVSALERLSVGEAAATDEAANFKECGRWCTGPVLSRNPSTAGGAHDRTSPRDSPRSLYRYLAHAIRS